MAKVVDARGLACPEPVVLTKQAVESGELNITVIVDNKAASKNVSRFAKKCGYEVNVAQKDKDFELKLSAKEKEAVRKTGFETVIFINRAGIGGALNYVVQGGASEELGSVLIRSFLYALTESSNLPSKIVFMNEGVKLTVEGAETVESLKKLCDSGVEVLVCGTCLDYFNLKDKVAVGEISNMYEILSSFMEAEKVVTV